MKIRGRLWKTNSLRCNVLVPLILVLILLLGSLILFLQQSQQQALELELAAKTKTAASLFLEYKEANAKLLSLALNTLVLNKELLSAFKARDRERLHDLTQSYFEGLRSHYAITHLYFTGPDRVNILRLHKPDHFGDTIDRTTTLTAEQTGEESQGVELGSLGTFTLRVVTPWHDGKSLVGYVELGTEVGQILKELQTILDSRVCAFIEKEFIQRKNWEAGMQMLGHQEKWGHFPETVSSGAPLGQIPEQVAQVIAAKKPLQSVTTITDVSADGKYYRVAFIPLRDTAQRKIGHLAILLDTTARISAFHQSVLLICGFYVLVGAVLCWFFYLLLGRIERKQQRLEEACREFEQGYRIIFDSVNDGIQLVDIETKKIFLANKTMCSMLGYDPEEIKTIDLADIHPVEALPHVADHFERTQRGEHTLEENLPVIRKDGSIFYADINASAVTLGRTGYLVGIFRDITERMKGEERIRESEARYRSIFESADDIIYLLNPDGTFRSLNPAFEKITGWTAEEWLNQPFAPIVHPDDLPRAQEIFKKNLAGEASPSISLRLARKSGGYFDAELCNTPITAIGGEVVTSTVGIARDVSERMRAEAEIRQLNTELEDRVLRRTKQLQESEEQFRAMSVSAQDAIIMMDNNGRVSFWNEAAERIFGYSKQESIGKVVHEILTPPRHQGEYLHAFPAWRIAGEGAAVNKTVELTALCKDGREIPIELSLASVKIQGLWNAIAIIRDITERKQTEMKIRRMNDELQQNSERLLAAQEELIRKGKLAILGQISGSVGHELRNPLAVISNAVYYLKMVLTDADATTQEYLDIIKQEIDNSLRIITDLLDFARTRAPRKESISLRELLDKSIGSCVIPDIVKLQIEIPEALPLLRIDPLQLEQVLQNLIMNAVQAMPDGGILTLRGSQNSEATICLEVVDNGEGISPENMNSLFQPLFTTKAKGIGLGLVVCKNLVEVNSGRIEVASEPGQGTTFSVELPIERGTG